MALSNVLDLPRYDDTGFTSPEIQEVKENIRIEKTRNTMARDEIKVIDKEWVMNKAMASLSLIPKRYRGEMFHSNAHVKFQDSSFGGNEVMNPRPQFTRYADIRADNLLVDVTSLKKDNPMQLVSIYDNTANHGMGRYYSESIDDWKQVVHLQFGLPKFNGVLTYLRNAVNYTDLYIANHGKRPWLYYFGKAIGYANVWRFHPYIFVFGMFSYLVNLGLDYVMGNKPFNYYYLEPNMTQYWSTVNNIANTLLINSGILDPIFDEKAQAKVKQVSDYIKEREFTISKSDIEMINMAFGEEVISEKAAYIDIYKAATKYQTRMNLLLKAYHKLKNKAGVKDGQLKEVFASLSQMTDILNYLIDTKTDGFLDRLNGMLYSYTDDLKAYNSLVESNRVPEDKVEEPKPKKDEKGEETKESTESTNEYRTPDGYTALKKLPDALNTEIKDDHLLKMYASLKENPASNKKVKNSWFQGQREQLDAALRGSALYVSLAVDPTGQSSETFSNSVGELAMAGTLKSVQSTVRHAKLNMNGIVGDGLIGGIMDKIGQVASGLIDAVTFDFSGVVRSLLSGAYMDIPKVWEDSETSFPNVSFTMDLVTPYGNAFSRFQNILVPLSIILAGALPRKVGNSAYTSPFLCSCFSKSVRKIDLGIITDVTITRGTTNLMYNKSRKVNGISVQFTVTDLTGKIAAPVNSSSITDIWNVQIDTDTPFADYLGILGGLDLYDITYNMPKFKRRISNTFSRFHQKVSGIGFGVGEWVEQSAMGLLFSNKPTFTGK